MIAKALEVDYSILTRNELLINNEQDEASNRNWQALTHLSGLLPLFFPTSVLWNRKRNEVTGLTEHYRAAMVAQGSTLLGCLIGLWVFYQTRQSTLIFIFLLIGAFNAIWNTIKVLNGEPFKYFMPFHKLMNKKQTTQPDTE